MALEIKRGKIAFLRGFLRQVNQAFSPHRKYTKGLIDI